MNKLGVLAGVCSILSFGVLGCNENPASVNDLDGRNNGEISSSSVQESWVPSENSVLRTEKKSSSSAKNPSSEVGRTSSSVLSSSSKTESSSSRPFVRSSFPESSSSEAPIETRSWYNHTT